MHVAQHPSAAPVQAGGLFAPPKDGPVARKLIAQHFVMQDERPPALDDVTLEELGPELRMLLFTDGTVTRALEAWALCRVVVDVVDEHLGGLPDELAVCLDCAAGAEVRHRRVTLQSADDGTPLVYAESLILFERLPAGFLALLAHSRQGIGEALSAGRFESRRELLWFGLSSAPDWHQASFRRQSTLARTYRIVIDDAPVMVITEAFPVQPALRSYTLAAW
jgi:chorismate-pyruvate lyase